MNLVVGGSSKLFVNANGVGIGGAADASYGPFQTRDNTYTTLVGVVGTVVGGIAVTTVGARIGSFSAHPVDFFYNGGGVGGFDSSGNLSFNGYLKSGARAVASLAACNAGTKAARDFVTDSNAVSYTLGIGAIVAAGGATNVPVVCDGTNWRIG